MHVLQLGPYPPPEGGINRNIIAIRADLAEDGHETSVIATSRSSRVVEESGVYHPRSPLALIRLLLSLKRDLTHLHIGGKIGARVLGLAFASALLSRGPSILTLHSGGYPQTKEGRSARRWSIRGFIFRMFDRIIVVNDQLKGVFLNYGVEPGRISVILPYVNELPDESVVVPEPLAAFAAKCEPFLLTVGLLEPEYDLAMQIDAMEGVVNEHPKAGLMIVGSGSLDAELRGHIASKSYRENIFLAGDVPHAVTLRLIEMTDILLRTTRFDGDAISIREALFLDTPVIASDNGMRPQGVTLIPVGGRDELGSAIGRIFRAPRNRSRPETNDRSNIRAVIKVYEGLISKQNHTF
ncbi:MAG: glycosyltransferase family 4 protein [Pyrinomonadaceae bacterium]|nr:glycosyltransferase family 4 protein [Pyrinomonadaceae bacterium]